MQYNEFIKFLIQITTIKSSKLPNQSIIQITKINISFITIVNKLANNPNLENLLMQQNEPLKKYNQSVKKYYFAFELTAKLILSCSKQ